MDRHPLDVDAKEEALYVLKKTVSELTAKDLDTVFLYIKRTNKELEEVVAEGGTHETVSDLKFYAGVLDDLLRLDKNDRASLAGEALDEEGDPDSDSYN